MSARREPAGYQTTIRVWEKDVLTRSSATFAPLATVLGVLLILVMGCVKSEEGTGISATQSSGAGDRGTAPGESSPPRPLKILYPSDEALFPPDIVAPTFRWEDPDPSSDKWLIRFSFQEGPDMEFQSDSTEWTPADESWEAVKERSVEVTITGVKRGAPDRPISRSRVSISISEDAVDAPIFFREVNLPFVTAVKDPAAHIRWRFGPISAKQPPPIVLDNLPVCGNCHSFSADGAVLGMDVDHANDKGAYTIIPVAKEMRLCDDTIITWSDFRREDDEPTFGQLSQMSPDGRYAISTVKDRSVFVAKDDLAFSQLFFDIKGILAVYDRETKSFAALPGADDPRYVQTNATWSPDGKYIVFARHTVHTLKNLRRKDSVLLEPDEASEFLTENETFKYDLYRIPFNDGKGGKAEPIEGASNNGMSNYFPKFSPDGKWIVFCKAKSFMLLQPDSELYIMPAAGGQARRLRCNTSRMNSWHSWSPNGKWLVFSSKVYSAYTQLFLTHIDERGRSSVPVVLSRFTVPKRAANIPEFVNVKPDAIGRLSADFLDGEHYYRAALTFIDQEDLSGAEPMLRKSLEIDPANVAVRIEMVDILLHFGRAGEAKRHLAKIIELQPDHLEAQFRLASVLNGEERLAEAAVHYRRALQIEPDFYEARVGLGLILLKTGELDESVEHLSEAVRLEPKSAFANYYCGSVLHRLDKLEEASGYYHRAIEHNPELLPALLGLASIHIMTDRPELFDVEKALTVAKKACEVTDYQHPEALKILAGVYAVAGEYADAVNTANKAVEIARAGGAPDLAERIQTMLKVYQQLREKEQR